MSTSPETPSISQVRSSRIFPTNPVHLYSFFNDPDKLAKWWGPKGFTNTIHEFDLRPGGVWRLTMHGPDEADYENHKEFIEVLPTQKISFRHSGAMHQFIMTIRFETVDDHHALMEWLMDFEKEDINPSFKEFILNANEDNFDRLEALLAHGEFASN